MKDEPIGFLIPEFPSQTHIAWWRVARELRELGYEVHLLSTRRQQSGDRVHPLLDAELDSVIFAWPPRVGRTLSELLRNPAGTWRAASYLASLRQSNMKQKTALFPVLLSALYLSSELRRRHIGRVFVHSCANAAHLLAMCNRMVGTRYALRLGGDPDVYGRDHHHKMQRAEFVLSASPSYYEELVDQHEVERRKLFWSWVGTDLDFYETGPTWPQNRRGDLLRIATVARLNRAKGHLYALEAVRDLVSSGRNVEYSLIGEGPFRKEIEGAIVELGLQAHVRLLGSQDAARIADILRSTDLTILPSVGAGEAAPAVICESMACGVPVIATRIGATEHMIEDGVDGFLVEQRDSGAIRDRLIAMSDDADRLARMKQAAKDASAKFDARRTAEYIIELFEQARERRN